MHCLRNFTILRNRLKNRFELSGDHCVTTCSPEQAECNKKNFQRPTDQNARFQPQIYTPKTFATTTSKTLISFRNRSCLVDTRGVTHSLHKRSSGHELALQFQCWTFTVPPSFPQNEIEIHHLPEHTELISNYIISPASNNTGAKWLVSGNFIAFQDLPKTVSLWCSWPKRSLLCEILLELQGVHVWAFRSDFISFSLSFLTDTFSTFVFKSLKLNLAIICGERKRGERKFTE